MNKIKDYYLAPLLALAIITISYTIFTPFWQTNDDVGMSMIAHGYGIAMYPSPYLIFSNVIWGEIVKNIPSIFGVLGYSLATISIIFVALYLCVETLSKKYNLIIAITLALILFLRPIVYPQFTIIAGISFIAAFLFYYKFAKSSFLPYLLASVIFAYLSFLIRLEQFLLMLVISLPIILKITRKYELKQLIIMLILLIVMALSYVYNIRVYEDNDWKFFFDFRNAVSPIVNFNSASFLLKNEALLQVNSISSNDIRLLQTFFFADRDLVNIEILRALTSEIKYDIDLVKTAKNLITTVKFFLDGNILVLSFISLALIFISPSWVIISSWLIFFIAMAIMCLIDRPAVERVILPVMIFLLLCQLLENSKEFNQYLIIIGIILLLTHSFEISADNYRSQMLSKDRHEFYKIMKSAEPMVVLGSDLPYEALYPVLANNLKSTPKIYGVGSFTWAPFSVASHYSSSDQGFKNRFIGDGVDIVINNLSKLNLYCKEHFKGAIEVIDFKLGLANSSKLGCSNIINHAGYSQLLEYVNGLNPSIIYMSENNEDLVDLFEVSPKFFTINIVRGIVEIVNPLDRKFIVNNNTVTNKIIILNKMDDELICLKSNNLKNFHISNKKVIGSYVIYNVM